MLASWAFQIRNLSSCRTAKGKDKGHVALAGGGETFSVRSFRDANLEDLCGR